MTTPDSTLRNKRRVLGVALVALTAWPAVHRVLCARYDLNPWKFFGLAMYAAHQPEVKIRGLEVARGAGAFRPVRLADEAPDSPVRQALMDLAYRRSYTGKLARGGNAVETLFGAYPDATRLAVLLVRFPIEDDIVGEEHLRLEFDRAAR